MDPQNVEHADDGGRVIIDHVHEAGFGSRLRAAREARGYTVEACGQALRLPSRLLRQLEAGDYSGIDYQVYLAGYLGKYGRHVGVDEEAIQAEVARLTPRQPELVVTGGVSHSRYLLERYVTAATYVVLTAVIVVPMVWLGVRGTLDRDMPRLAPLDATPVAQQHTFTMLTSAAKKDGLKTMSDLSKLPSFSYAGYPECQTRITCILGMKQIYGLKNIKFVQIGTISVYTLLDEHKADGGDGFSTDPQQLDSKYTALVDDKHIFGFQNVAPVVKKSLLSGPNGTLLEQTLNNVSAKLTLNAMQQMNKAIVIDKVAIPTVAKKFLQANGLA